jgi:REP element-mobilizing transposase RayT
VTHNSKQIGADPILLPNSLPTVIRSFKSAVTKKTNVIRGIHVIPLWQRNYYEHIICSEEELNRFREYIQNNPMQWEGDEENSERETHGG